MRPHEKQEQDFKPHCLFSDVALLVCEARVPDPLRGRTEGPHCPGGRSLLQDNPDKHNCHSGNHLCDHASQVKEKSLELWSSQLPLCVQVVGMPTECHSLSSHCPSGGLLLEKWLCQVQPRRNPDERLLAGQFLLQAIRSHLHFSMLSAWLSKGGGKLPFRLQYLTSLPGEQDKEVDSGYCYETHQFPSCQIEKALVLTVSVQSLPHLEDPPVLKCACQKPPITVPSSSSNSIHEPAIAECSGSQRTFTSTTDKNQGTFKSGQQSDPLFKNHHTKGVALAPVELPSVGGHGYSVENPLFSTDGHCDSDSLKDRMSSLDLPGCAKEDKKSPRRRRARQVSDSCDTDKAENVKFYISSDEQEKQDTLHDLLAQNSSKGRDREGTNRSLTSTTNKIHRKRLSQKILFTGDDDIILSEDGFDEERSELCSPSEMDERKEILRKATFTEALCGTSYSNQSSQLKPQKASPTTSGGHRNCLPRYLTEGMNFSRKTGLPLSSSPAPLKRNQHSFDYDTTLNSVAGLRSALYHDHDSGSSDSESGTSLCKSAPASTNLLGNFEESALNGRIKPFGSIDGFTLDLAASGAFCPAHAILPVVTFFFNVSDDNAPSPYLGHCDLEVVGKKGYHIPRKGTVQATLFNPQGTVVKMFVVRYDMSEMPPSCQTFLRQRTFFMPSSASLQDAQQNRSWLRYLIHLRFATSRSGKLYMHSDIRMLFSRKSELDANNLEREPGKCIATSDAGNYELRSFTEMPKNPKFSPKKFGGQTRSEKESYAK